ncbi:UvrD-helicase domain-containing protein [Clostridium kluyveri]|uniref:UvrD-helicase domain-containing protein n=1 Tax=Clostridium kluyveri TaxID=1534 RepID=UPI0022455344|nr:UvrD-helicase domain-containing protein [Clostridium kluyveri]UZQ48825.1 UvrD-helicase domain-containing protein [Clostridium kluyveri]
MITKLLCTGVLRYKDAFILAEEYLKRCPNVASFFKERFRYVFIDEMQDTRVYQQSVIGKIFNPKEVILQRFGDINQNISSGENDEGCGWSLYENIKSINTSKRYGEELVKFLSPLRIHKDGDLKGNNEVKTTNPHILVFNDNCIFSVVNRFNEVLEALSIKIGSGDSIKAIGKIGINVMPPNLSIKSYIPSYNKPSGQQAFSKKVRFNLQRTNSTKSFYEQLISIIILVLNQNKFKFTKEEFVSLMEESFNNEFIKYKSKIVKWFLEIKDNYNVVIEEVKNETAELLKCIDNLTIAAEDFNKYFRDGEDSTIANKEVATTSAQTEETKYSFFTEINTVHGVKGETHLATLYLESKLMNGWGKDLSDISILIDYMVGKNKEVTHVHKEALAIAYVALSRARLITCLGIHYNTIKGRVKELIEYGYVVIPCDEEIEHLLKNEGI